MRLLNAQRNSLAVLTSREPNYVFDESRFIFAVFLVDESYEGDYRDAGYVTTTSEWKITFTLQEAQQILRDIAGVRTIAKGKEFARRFFEHFCKINGIYMEQVPPPAGALTHEK